MKKLILPLLALLWPLQLWAQHSPVVVELYTSQGCSSCPPADKLMHDLAKRDDVIALALHVDYWDYIGWKDAFADPAHTRRQQAYAHVGGRQVVYTPQMIIGGQDDVVGARSMQLADLINAQKARRQPAVLEARRTGSELTLTNTGVIQLNRPADIHLVRFDPSRTVDIKRGENAGRRLTYSNVVDDWQVIGQWDGSTPLSLTANLPGDLPAVILLQDPGPGRILSATRVK